MPFPVTVNGQTYNLSDFAGLNYLVNFPDSLDELAKLAAAPRGWTSVSSVSLGSGSKSFTIATGLAEIFAGANTSVKIIVRAYNSATNYMDGEVASYNSGTGVLQINVNDATLVKGAGTFASWTIAVLAWDVLAQEETQFLPLGADAGGYGKIHQVDDSRVAFMTPTPRMGYVLEEEFYPGLPSPYVSNLDRFSRWIVNCAQPNTAFTGQMATRIVGAAIVTPINLTDNPVPLEGNIEIPLALGTQGFLSVGSPGDLYFSGLIGFAATTKSVTLDSRYYFGLRANNSSLGNIFDRYGLGFEIAINELDLADFYAVSTQAGVVTRTLIGTGYYGFCTIWVDSFAKVAWFHFAASGGSTPASPGDIASYSYSVDISGWPADDPAFFVHPAASVVASLGATPSAMYVDRIYLHKALER